MMVTFFDVDKTLIDGYSGYYTTLLLIKKGILKKRRLAQALFYRLIGPLFEGSRHSHRNVHRIYEIAMSDMAGMPLQEVLQIGRECFEKDIRPRLFQEGIDRVHEHKKKGDAVYFLTSGPYMTIMNLAEFLGVDGSYSGGSVVDTSGRLTREIKFPICYREGKVLIAEEILKKHGARWEDATYYADSMDDLFVFEKVGHPVLVNPGKKLASIGQKRGWPVMRFQKTISS